MKKSFGHPKRPLILLISATVVLAAFLLYAEKMSQSTLEVPAQTESRLLQEHMTDILSQWEEGVDPTRSCVLLSDEKTMRQQNPLLKYQAPAANIYVMAIDYREDGREKHDFYLAELVREKGGYRLQTQSSWFTLDGIPSDAEKIMESSISCKPKYSKSVVNFHFGEVKEGYLPVLDGTALPVRENALFAFATEGAADSYELTAEPAE